jgi:hypothetical protein
MRVPRFPASSPEQDPDKLVKLIEEINRLLEEKERRLKYKQATLLAERTFTLAFVDVFVRDRLALPLRSPLYTSLRRSPVRRRSLVQSDSRRRPVCCSTAWVLLRGLNMQKSLPSYGARSTN